MHYILMHHCHTLYHTYVYNFCYPIHADDDGSAQKLSALDYVMIVLAALTIIGGIAYLANLIFGKVRMLWYFKSMVCYIDCSLIRVEEAQTREL